MYGYTMNKKAVSDRLRRIEGQVRGIQRMVEEDQYCIDILTQVNSAASALKSVGMGVLDDHVRHCVKESVESGDSEEKLEELLKGEGLSVHRRWRYLTVDIATEEHANELASRLRDLAPAEAEVTVDVNPDDIPTPVFVLLESRL